MTKLVFQVMCVTVVQRSRSCLLVQINRVRLPATLFSVSLYRFFFCSVPFLTLFFLLAFFSVFLTADTAGHALGSIYILTLRSRPESYFGKGISKALDLHTGQACDQKKIISCQDMSLLWNCWSFFNVSWHRDKQNTVHHKVYLFTHPPVTHWRKLIAFCTSS